MPSPNIAAPRLVAAIALCGLLSLAAQQAQAQTCEERRRNLAHYRAEAASLREAEANILAMGNMSDAELQWRLQKARNQNAAAATTNMRKVTQTQIDYIVSLQASRATMLPLAPAVHPHLSRVRALREQVATNIAHTTAAMQSMRCDQLPQQRPGFVRPQARGGPLPDYYYGRPPARQAPAQSGGSSSHQSGGLIRDPVPPVKRQ